MSTRPRSALAAELLLWGRPITAQRAYEIGYVNKVVPKEQLMDEAMEWAEYMCTLGQPSVRAHKEMLYRGRDMSTGELQALGRDLFYWVPRSPVYTSMPRRAREHSPRSARPGTTARIEGPSGERPQGSGLEEPAIGGD